jgi:hypothetical protein
MKGVKKIMMVLMVFSMIVVFAGQAHAKWFTLSVVYTNCTELGDVQILLEKANGKRATFTAPTDHAKEMLAMALTVQASGGSLKLSIEADRFGGPITSMRVVTAAP